MEYFLSSADLGRPKCEAITSLAPFSKQYLIVGRLAVIRVSSVIFPSFNGTLRSRRKKTVLPVISKSLIVLMPFNPCDILLTHHV